MRPRAVRGQLHHAGQVEVVSSLERDGQPLPYDIRFGVWVVFEGDTEYIRRCFTEYGVRTDPSGQYACCTSVGISSAWKSVSPLPQWGSAVSPLAAQRVSVPMRLPPQSATSHLARSWTARGCTVVGRLMPAADALKLGTLPLGLAHGWTLTDRLLRVNQYAGRIWRSTRQTAPCKSVGKWSRCSHRSQWPGARPVCTCVYGTRHWLCR